MAATAQTQAVLPLEPPSWAVRPTVPRHRRRWSFAAAGVAGVGVLVATIVVVIARGGAVSGDPTQGRGTVAASTDVSALGRGYGSLLDRYENAERAWRTQANKMVAASTGSAEALIPPTVHFADTVDQADHDLVHLPWPPSMRADVNALEADLATVSGDLRSIGGQSVSSMPQWLSNVVDDASASSTASNRLMGDLGGTASG